ncbi:hypothetical protein J6590_020751 [Homalodisca vitripennis]|nr:hypothetical protein J6590_020751 [Homalodisca vitripennis]
MTKSQKEFMKDHNQVFVDQLICNGQTDVIIAAFLMSAFGILAVHCTFTAGMLLMFSAGSNKDSWYGWVQRNRKKFIAVNG